MYRELGKILFKTFIIKIKNMESEAGYSFMWDMFSFFFPLNFCCSNCDNNRNLTVNHNELVRAHQLIGYLTDMATSMLMSLYTLISWLDVLTDMTTSMSVITLLVCQLSYWVFWVVFKPWDFKSHHQSVDKSLYCYFVFHTLWILCVLCVRKKFVGSSMRFSVMVVTSGSIERVILVSFYMSF